MEYQHSKFSRRSKKHESYIADLGAIFLLTYFHYWMKGTITTITNGT